MKTIIIVAALMGLSSSAFAQAAANPPLTPAPKQFEGALVNMGASQMPPGTPATKQLDGQIVGPAQPVIPPPKKQ